MTAEMEQETRQEAIIAKLMQEDGEVNVDKLQELMGRSDIIDDSKLP